MSFDECQQLPAKADFNTTEFSFSGHSLMSIPFDSASDSNYSVSRVHAVMIGDHRLQVGTLPAIAPEVT